MPDSTKPTNGKDVQITNWEDLQDPMLAMIISGMTTVDDFTKMQQTMTTVAGHVATQAADAAANENTYIQNEITQLGQYTGSDNTEKFNQLQAKIGSDTAIANADANNRSTDVNMLGTASGPTATQAIASDISGLSDAIQGLRTFQTAIESFFS